MRVRFRKPPWIAVQAVVTIGLLVLVLRSLDLEALRAVFAGLPVSFYLLSLSVMLAGQIAYAWRWRLLLRGAGLSVPFATVVRQYFVGVFANNFMPGGADVAKVMYLGRDHGYRTVAASVAVDRLLGVSLLAILASAALWLSPVSAPRLVAANVIAALIAAASLLLLLLTGFGTGGLAARVARFGARAVTLAERLQRLRLDMAAPLGRPTILVQSAFVVFGYAVAVAALYLHFVAMHHGPASSPIAVFAVVTAITVLSNVPVSLNGLGLREQLHAALFLPLGVAPETAVSMSLLLYAHLVIMSAIGYVFWLESRPQSPKPARSPVGV
jgi:glycosyltransferase 2 family protein